MTEPAPRAFLSYSHVDTPAVERLKSSFEALGWDRGATAS